MFCSEPMRAKRSKSRWSAEAGFTLLEVLTVASVLAIGGMIALPGYIQWYSRYQLQQSTTQLSSSLTLSRMTAMNRNTTIMVTPNFVACPPLPPATPNCNRVTVNITDATGTVIMAPEVLFQQVTAVAGGPIQFNSLGLRIGGGAGNQLIQLVSNQGLTYSVATTPAGRAFWCPKATCP